MNDNTRNYIESLEEYKRGLLRSIAIGIQARNRDDDYSVGLRNGLRVCKAYIDGLEPEYEKCKPSASPNSSESPNGWIPCTPETMPEDEYVLISKKPTKISGNKWNVAIAIRTADPRSRKIQWRDSGFGVIQDDKVLAWMPLPDPYQPEEESE